jgi:hypothetical protein
MGRQEWQLSRPEFGPEERKKYGVHEGQSVGDQVVAAENFLRDRGVKPGMGLPDIYSTINAGSPGLYNASDAGNGGAPGTVMDKVTNQMAGHRLNASRLLGMDAGMLSPQATALPAAGTATQPGAPAAAPANDSAFMASLANIPKMLAAQQKNQQFAPAPVAPDNLRARMAMIAAARQGQPV